VSPISARHPLMTMSAYYYTALLQVGSHSIVSQNVPSLLNNSFILPLIMIHIQYRFPRLSILSHHSQYCALFNDGVYDDGVGRRWCTWEGQIIIRLSYQHPKEFLLHHVPTPVLPVLNPPDVEFVVQVSSQSLSSSSDDFPSVDAPESLQASFPACSKTLSLAWQSGIYTV
jgi:hypothetical protein